MKIQSFKINSNLSLAGVFYKRVFNQINYIFKNK